MTTAKASLDITNIRMVVFDIDGTIADTANLVPNKQRRKPDDILRLLDPSAVDSDLLRIKNIRGMTSNFNRCGIRVAVISSAPAAYVGTLCFLMGVEADTIIASNTSSELSTKADRLRWLARTSSYVDPHRQIEVQDILYVGDLPEDSAAAEDAGCLFQNIETYLSDIEQSSPLSRLERLCEDIVLGNLHSTDSNLNWHIGCFKERKIWQLDWLEDWTESWYGIEMDIPQSITDPSHSFKEMFNPFEPNSPIQRPLLDPSFMTREEYKYDRDLRRKLFEAIASYAPAQLQRFDEKFPYLSKVETYAHLKYWNTRLGQDLWKSIKHWHDMKSGPEVNLLHLEFIALFMASSIWAQHNLGNSNWSKPAIVPLPSSPYSSSSPARVSNRLARRIAQLTDLPFVEILEKRGNEIAFREGNEVILDSVILIDDQLTEGYTAEKCLAEISGKIENVQLRVWTSKRFKSNSLGESAIDYPVAEFSSEEFAIPQVEKESQVIVTGQRVLTRRFGLGRILSIDSGWMVIDFKTLGTFRYPIDSSEVEFLE